MNIFDAAGMLVHTNSNVDQEQIQLELNDLAPGQYFVMVQTISDAITQRFLKL